MGESNFLDFCKHGRKQTCYTEAAEVLRWQTRAACQKRRRSCQTNCNKTKINFEMENEDTVSSKPSAEKSLSHFQGEHCHTIPPRSLMITLSSLTSSTAITTSSLNGLLQSSKNLISQSEKGKSFGFFKPEKQPALLSEGIGAVKSHWTVPGGLLGQTPPQSRAVQSTALHETPLTQTDCNLGAGRIRGELF